MIDFKNLCKNCMSDKSDLKRCPFCGYVNDSTENENLILQGKYVLGNKISENAESICYIGYDLKNDAKVHIREFFPMDICFRAEDGQTVSPKESCEDKFEHLKSDFLIYFRMLAKVRDVEAIASVYDIFRDYGTVYVVSELVEGILLYDLVERNQKPLDWEAAKILFMPVISAFGKLARAGILHLSVTPRSLIVGKNGKIYISDFSTHNLRQAGVYSTFEFERGFTAPEQYIKNCELTQSTDVYGFAATLFFALVGFAPKDASERSVDDRLLIPVRLLKNIPPYVVSAISNALKVNVQQRTQTFEALRDELTETSAKYLSRDDLDLQRSAPVTNRNKRYNLRWIVGSTVVGLALCVAMFALFMNKKNAGQIENLPVQNEFSLQAPTNEDNIIVPDLVGQDFEKAKASSEAGDYNIFLSEKVFSDEIEAGKIVSQTPAPDTSVRKGANIVVTVSKGSKYRALPEIEGLSLSQAAAKLSKEGFVPVQESIYNSSVEPGSVIGYKGRDAGEKVEVGAEVTILVSKGKI